MLITHPNTYAWPYFPRYTLLPEAPPAGDLVGTLARVHPIVVHVDRFRQEVYRRLVVLHAHPTGYARRVPTLVHLHFAGLFVVAEGAVELLVQGFDILALRRGLSLRLSTSHGGARICWFICCNEVNFSKTIRKYNVVCLYLYAATRSGDDGRSPRLQILTEPTVDPFRTMVVWLS